MHPNLSPIPIQRTGNDRHLLLLTQHCIIHREHYFHISTFLHPQRNLQSIIHAPYRAIICPGCSGIFRHCPDQHITIRTWPCRAMVKRRSCSAFLVRLRLRSSCLNGHLSSNVRSWTFLPLLVVTSNRWSTKSFTIGQMTPVWIFPAYPMLIIGPHAAVLSQTLKADDAFDVIVGGFTIQGIGFLVSLMIYSAFIYRLMTQKLPQEATRPGMFVSVGPCGFTVFGVVEMANSAVRALPPDFMGDGRLAAMILKVVASWMGLWLWGLALWFFFISIGAHWSCVGRNKMTFAM